MKLKALWYCTKNKPYLFDCYQGTLERCAYVTCYSESFKGKDYVLNGKIVAVSDFNVMNIYGNISKDNQPYYEVHSQCLFHEYWLTEKSRLNHDKLVKYLGAYKGLVGHAIYIKNLNVFDKPKELSDYYKTFERIFYRPLIETHSSSSAIYIPESKIYFMDYCDVLKRAPQNMMYVYDKDGVKYVLISVRPEWLCLILNGLKDVELRRKILKEML